jgi:hypothetical protein
MHISDQELIEGFKSGIKTELYFQLLVGKYQERLYWHIRKIVLNHDDADDVLQKYFHKGLEKHRKLPGRVIALHLAVSDRNQ